MENDCITAERQKQSKARVIDLTDARGGYIVQ